MLRGRYTCRKGRENGRELEVVLELEHVRPAAAGEAEVVVKAASRHAYCVR